VPVTAAFKYDNLPITVQFRDSWECRLRTLVPSKIVAKATEILVIANVLASREGSSHERTGLVLVIY
jgi:hypothetical protein